ncbi:hypothetical protein Cadr_000002024 [Camelus dromedarius]|uniref:Uncharacterized protein n=1 Tax=Camelus dromedarius TaxID=9838 RepID=A0A5N4EF29_CAMDR|nr:hypothetical protein Cadr_000002024 [Camelus dromedarius]
MEEFDSGCLAEEEEERENSFSCDSAETAEVPGGAGEESSFQWLLLIGAKTEIVNIDNLQGVAYKLPRNSHIFQELLCQTHPEDQIVPADTMQPLHQSA